MRLVGGLNDLQKKRLDDDLFFYVRSSDVDGVKKTILLGADVNAIDPDSEPYKRKSDRSRVFTTPLISAIRRGYVHIVYELVKYGADVNKRESPILGDVEKSLYENEYHYKTGQGMYHGLKYLTPLMVAIEHEAEFRETENTIKILNILLRHGARVNDSMLGNVTALDLAVDYHLWDSADILLKNDPSPPSRDSDEINQLIRRIAYWKKYGS
jgi:hypothetical protein